MWSVLPLGEWHTFTPLSATSTPSVNQTVIINGHYGSPLSIISLNIRVLKQLQFLGSLRKDKERAESQVKERKSGTEGEKEEGAGRHAAKERRKTNEEPAEDTGVVQEEGRRTAEDPNRRKARSRVKTRCQDDKKTREGDHRMEWNRRSLSERKKLVYTVQISKKEIMK